VLIAHGTRSFCSNHTLG